MILKIIMSLGELHFGCTKKQMTGNFCFKKMFKGISNLSHAWECSWYWNNPSSGKKKKKEKKNYKRWIKYINQPLEVTGKDPVQAGPSQLWEGGTYGARHLHAGALLRASFKLWWRGYCCTERDGLIGQGGNLVWVQSCQDNLELSLEISNRKGIESRIQSHIHMPLNS